MATLAVLHAVELPAHALVVSDWEDGPHHSPILVVPRSAELQRDEDALGRALVVTVGGTRPVVSTAMVSSLLFERFGLTTQDADVRRHVPEDFIVRFRRPADRDRVLAAGPTGAPLPLIWNPWRRTSLAHSGAFRYRVLVGMRRIPLHAWNVPTVQTVLGPCCSGINIVRPIDVDDDDDRELFATAWCWHPRYVRCEQIIFVPEPFIPGANDEFATALRGLRYVIHIRLVAYQDFNTPPPPPGAPGPDDSQGDGDPSAQADEAPDYNPTLRRESDGGSSDHSNDSNFYNRNPPDGRRCDDAAWAGDGDDRSVRVGSLTCPLPAVSSMGPTLATVDVGASGPHAAASYSAPVMETATAADVCGEQTPVKSIDTSPAREIPISSPALTPFRSAMPGLGVVGQFLAQAPMLLHGGRSVASPPPLSQDWWIECAEIELAGPLLPRPASTVERATPIPNRDTEPQDVSCCQEHIQAPAEDGVCASPPASRSPSAGLAVDTTPTTPVGIVLVNKLCIPLQTPAIRAPPKTRKSRTPASPRTSCRSIRLAAKHREPDSTKQAQKVLLKKLGGLVLSPVADSEVARKFKATFSAPLSPAKREALQVLFDGDFDPESLGIDAVGLDEDSA